MPTNATRRQLLVTGCYRSGTTLLEKLLHAHPQISIGAQPFASLFSVVMESYHRSLGIERRYPLGHLFEERDYTPADLGEFLKDHLLSAQDLDRVFEQLDPNEDQTSARIRERRSSMTPGSFLSVLGQLMDAIGEIHPKSDCQVIGAKEIICEEFLPYLLAHGYVGVIIVRDPRDIVASTHYREHGHFTGKQRPILHTLRLWRKSVAFATALRGTEGFSSLRYEDLVTDPVSELRPVTSQVAVAELTAEALSGDIRDQKGNVWQSNSSFFNYSGVSNASVESYREHVPEAVVRYIETLCLPEMRLLGYPTRYVEAFDPEVVRRHRDGFDDMHRNFEADYSSDPARVSAEIARIEALTSRNLPDAEVRATYLFSKTYAALRDAMSRTCPLSNSVR